MNPVSGGPHVGKNTRPSSFMQCRDSDVLRALIPLHATRASVLTPYEILDVTYGNGTMWKGTNWDPYRVDLDPARGLDRVADFRDLSWSESGQWDVVVYDPPHISDTGATSTLAKRYGTGAVKGNSISHLFPDFLSQVGRILAPEGIVLAKIADQVHGNAHQWQLVEFINAVRAVGLVACDLVVKADPSAGKLQGLWKRVLHTRNSHCYWVVVRKGPRCFRRRPVPSATPTGTRGSAQSVGSGGN